MKIDLAKYIDHTFLGAAGEANAITKLCKEAKRYHFASVCVNPSEVPLAVRLLSGTKVAVCTVIDFPLGQATALDKRYEAEVAVENGATELDFVINQRLLKAAAKGNKRALKSLTAELRSCADFDGIVTKLILECCNLTDAEKRLGCKLAKAAGFDFVKTSTGFGQGGATLDDVKLMRKAVGKTMGVKAAGGIRDRATALKMIKAGATRLGCSSGVKLITEV